MGATLLTAKTLQWHPAFYAGIQIDLEKDRENMVFENEHMLSKKPMEIDILIIKKEKDVQVRKNIGRIFRKYNVIEYKSPTDYLSIDDFYKVYGYACFYKADTGRTDEISAEELTITLVSESYPVKLCQYLRRNRGYVIEEADSGIYYIKGDYIPIQIIVTSRLSEKKNLWLKNLTGHMDGTASARRLVEEYEKHSDENLYKAVMDVIVRANKEVFKEVNEMCDALKELMKDEIEAERQKGMQEGMQEGMQKGMREGMQKGMEEGMQKGIQKGMQKGIQNGIQILIESCREFLVPRDQTLAKVALKYALSADVAEKYMQKFW